jgi:hypothetical protein
VEGATTYAVRDIPAVSGMVWRLIKEVFTMAIKSPTTATSKVRSPHPKIQKMHELYLKRRSQRNAAPQKVVKQWHLVEEAEKVFDAFEEWNATIEEGSGIEVGSGMPAVPIATFAQAAE